MERLEYLGENEIKVYQDDELYTFTSDSILLSKFAVVKRNEDVADFCAGSGIVGFNLYALNKNLIKNLTFFEMQTPMFNLINKSIEENDLKSVCSAINTKLQEVDNSFNERFSLIVCNPPYMKVESGEVNKLDNIAVCNAILFATSLKDCICAHILSLVFLVLL